jgi:hypothetical protein
VAAERVAGRARSELPVSLPAAQQALPAAALPRPRVELLLQSEAAPAAGLADAALPESPEAPRP